MATGDLTTLADVKFALEITSTANDGLIGLLISSASSAIQHRYQREFYPVGTTTRRFEVQDRKVSLDPYDLLTPTTVTLYPESTSPLVLTRYTDYDLAPVGATTMNTYTDLVLSSFLVVTGQSMFRFGYANMDVAGTWGAAAVPADVARACIVTVASWRDRAVDQYGIQGIEAGRDMTPDNFTTWSIPSAAHRLMQAYERMSYV